MTNCLRNPGIRILKNMSAENITRIKAGLPSALRLISSYLKEGIPLFSVSSIWNIALISWWSWPTCQRYSGRKQIRT